MMMMMMMWLSYVNVSELVPRSSSSCDLDMSDFLQFVQLDNSRSLHGVCRKQYGDDVTSVRSRDHFARWPDGSRTMQARGATTTTTQWSNSDWRRLAGDRDHNCLLNGGTQDLSGQLACNGLLTRVKSLDSICKEPADEPTAQTKHRQRPRRRRRNGVKRSASTSRCLVATTNNKPTSSVDAPANG